MRYVNYVMDYQKLIQQFLNREISIDNFQTIFFSSFLNEPGGMDEELFQVLDELFGDLDSYTTDTELLASDPSFYLDEAGLRRKAAQALEKLKGLPGTVDRQVNVPPSV